MRSWSEKPWLVLAGVTLLASAQAADVPEELPAVHAPVPAARWSVINRFPLLKERAFQEIELRWKQSSGSMAGLIVRDRAGAGAADPSAEVAATHRFLLVNPTEAMEDQGWIRGAKVDVQIDVSGAARCEWHPPESVAAQNQRGCTLRISVPEDNSTLVLVHTDTGDLSVDIRPQSLVIAAIGDSYAAGEGSPDGPATYAEVQTPKSNSWIFEQPDPNERSPFGEAVVWWDQVCHRSLLSWPVLAALRAALDRPHYVIRLANVSCSGAEFFDGVFWAQEKANVRSKDGVVVGSRDGLPSAKGRGSIPYLPRTQINGLRDLLCSAELANTKVQIAGRETLWRDCTSLERKPDALLLSVGGNDIGFGPAVTGIVMPDKARKKPVFIAQWALNEARKKAGAITQKELIRRTSALKESYSVLLQRTIEGAKASPENTVLLAYPNPIGTSGSSCTKSRSTRMRLRNSFMTFGPAIQVLAGWPARDFLKGWVVEVNKDEVKEFIEKSYPEIERLQKTRTGSVQKIGLAYWAPEGNISFDGRRLCEELSDVPDRSLEAYYFCEETGWKGNLTDECTIYDWAEGPVVDGEGRRPNLLQWRYGAANRRIVNTMNDAFLAQRRWSPPAVPTDKDVRDAMSGAFHPTPEAHALAADSVYVKLCAILPSGDVPCPADAR